MKRIIHSLTIIGLASAGLLLIGGWLHINAFTIDVLDRKITQQHYNWHNGVYEWDEVRSNISWEDAMVSINPDYPSQLDADLSVIASQFQDISAIDHQEESISTPHYQVKVCIEEKQLSVKDSSLLKKHGDMYLSAYLELYDQTGCELLFKHRDRRFIVRDKFRFFGFGSHEFISNKAEELLYTEICENIPEFIWRFEGPYIYRQKKRIVQAFSSLYFKDWTKSHDAYQTATFTKK